MFRATDARERAGIAGQRKPQRAMRLRHRVPKRPTHTGATEWNLRTASATQTNWSTALRAQRAPVEGPPVAWGAVRRTDASARPLDWKAGCEVLQVGTFRNGKRRTCRPSGRMRSLLHRRLGNKNISNRQRLLRRQFLASSPRSSTWSVRGWTAPELKGRG